MSSRTESGVGAVREPLAERKPKRLRRRTAWPLQPVTLWGRAGGSIRCSFWGESSGLTREHFGRSPESTDFVLRVN